MSGPTEYDPRYVAGAAHFNRREFFEAHEIWEDLWQDTAGPDRRFYQGLIQAAVAVYHADNGNARGARRLFHSARRYMAAYPPVHLGLDVPAFWHAMERALADVLADPAPPAAGLRPDQLPVVLVAPMSAGGPSG